MPEPKVAGTAPIKVTLEAGRHAWCACGESQTQPFCDGAHRGGLFVPVKFTLEEGTEAFLCTCKRTKSAPIVTAATKRCKGPPMSLSIFAIGLAAAIGLGLAIGLERQIGQHPAGLRTNALVCGGAALFIMFARSINQSNEMPRVVGQIVSGMGFLGGGVILREGLTVRGLTTAATLWCSAAIGALCGAGLILEASIGTAAILGTNFCLNPVSRLIDRWVASRVYIETNYRLRAICKASDERHVRRLLTEQVTAHPNLVLHGIAIHATDSPEKGIVVADIVTHVRDEHALQEILTVVNADPSTFSASWERQ